MTIVVTRDVLDRYRGFLASAMPEVAPGVYVSPELSRGVRERVWGVVAEWWMNVLVDRSSWRGRTTALRDD
jgi:CRISPR-associated protein Cas2